MKEIQTDLILLLISTGVKALVLFVLASYLIIKWLHQEKRYMTDFPFLFSLGTFFYAGTKIYDMLIYAIYQNPLSSFTTLSSIELWVVRIRFFLSPVITLLPYFLLMLIIWFGGKKKLQWGIGCLWLIISSFAILSASNYPQLLFYNSLIAIPPIILSIVTYFIINYQKRLPQINSLILAIGWCAYAITQLIRPIWVGLGSGSWGLTWVGELLEMGAFIIIFLGFIRPASYSQELKSSAPKKISKKNKQENIIHTLEISQ